jgi:tRNA threonylcarbamoyl adenosine modification protein YeaZ
VIVLGIDTSAEICGVAVNDGECTLYECVSRVEKSHARILTDLIAQCLNFAGMKPKDVDLFAAAVGPGSYTGLRIGVATVKGMAQALGKPAVGVGTMDATARTYAPFFDGREFFIAMDSRPGEIYGAIVGGDGKVCENLGPCPTDGLENIVSGRTSVTNAPTKMPLGCRWVGHTVSIAPAVACLALQGSVRPLSPLYLKPVFKTTPKNPAIVSGKQADRS